MTPLEEVLVFDYETTGIDILKDRPVQVGVSDANGRILINTLCDPCMPIDPEAAEVHGISNANTVGFPDYAIALYAQLALFHAYDDPIIAGFNSSMFDGPMMEACLGLPVLQRCRTLDLMDVTYRYWPGLENKKLVDLHEQFLGRPLVGAHGAIQDCIGTGAVMQVMCDLLQKSPDDLAEELVVPQPYSIMPIGKYRGQRIEDVPKTWSNWMSKNADNMRPDLVETVRWDNAR